MIEIRHLSKRFYSLVALNDVSLDIPRGEVIGILGPNGAGKTTLLKLIAGLLFPDAGTIRPVGRPWPTIGFKPERLIFPGRLRVREYLKLVARLSQIPPDQVEEQVAYALARVQLTEAAGKRIRTASKGMRQRLGLAQALLGDPPLLLIDEPSNGLDPDGQALVNQIIRELQAAGKTIILNSHQLQEVTEVCTDLVILNRGQVRYRSSMAAAVRMRPHTTIEVDRDLAGLRRLLKTLDPAVHVNDTQITLEESAVPLRRDILSILLGAGYDVVGVEQKRLTLAEIYREVVQ